MAFDVDEFLKKTETKAAPIVEPTVSSTFNPDEFIKSAPDYVATSEPKMVAETEVIKEQPSVSALPGGVMTGPTGIKELGQIVQAGAGPYGQGITQGLKNTADIYKARPIVAPLIDAIGLGTVGVPPIATGQQALGAYEKYNAIKQGAKAAGQVASQGAPVEMLNAAGELITRPETVKPYFEMKKATTPAFAQKITEAYGAQTGGGGNNAVRALLNSPEGVAMRYTNPQFAAAAQAYLNTVPTYTQQAMKVVAPLAKGALKVAGPVGTAYNVYEAGQLARETQLGEKLAGGQGQRAEQAFRNMNTQYGRPISPQEEQNVMAYGSQRDIQALIRRKAAQRVLGPIAPQ